MPASYGFEHVIGLFVGDQVLPSSLDGYPRQNFWVASLCYQSQYNMNEDYPHDEEEYYYPTTSGGKQPFYVDAPPWW